MRLLKIAETVIIEEKIGTDCTVKSKQKESY